jgi:hypothetical protein
MSPERQAHIRKAAAELSALTTATQQEYDTKAYPLRRRLAALKRGEPFDLESGDLTAFPKQDPPLEPVPGLETATLTKGEGI